MTILTGLRSRRHIAPFELARPECLAACASWIARPGRTALMAGGFDLIDRMKAGEAFDTIVSLADVPELSGIHLEGGTLVVGAMTTHAKIANDPLVAAKIPGLTQLWRQIANPRVRDVGTIGGNLMSARPHYDVLPILRALGATATVATASQHSDRREVTLDALFPDNTLLIDIRIPVPSIRILADRSLHPTVAVYLGAPVASGAISEVRLSVGCAYERAQLAVLPCSLPLSSNGTEAAPIAARLMEMLPMPLCDGLASATYRRRMIEVLARRLLVKLGSAT